MTGTRDDSPALSRRQVLGMGLGAAAAGVLLPTARALAGPRSKIRDIYRGRRGTTIWLDLDNAPFPAKGEPWQDPTVIVFVPHYYRVRKNYKVDTVVHFHGYRDTAESAMKRHQLREQLWESKQNAIIVFPQGPVRAESPSFGKLDAARGLLNFLTEVRKTLQTPRLQARLGPAGIPNRARIGRLVLSAHSGGFRVVARAIKHGGFEVSEVYLFDALYGRAPIFADWLAGSGQRGASRRKLVSYYSGDDVSAENRRLMSALQRRGIPFGHEQHEGSLSKKAFTKSRAVFVQTRVSHQGVLFRTNALRDCLYASGLKRYLKSKWFARSSEPRTVERRKPE